MRYTLSALVLAACCVATPAGPAYSQLPRDRAEKAHDRQQLRQDTRATRDDVQDALRIDTLLERFDAAAAASDHAALDALDGELHAYLRGEVGESKVEATRAQREVRQDRREKRSDRREVRDNRVQDAPPLQRADDRRDLRDDRRDLRDDRRDAATEQAELARKREIEAELVALDRRYDAQSLAHKRALLVRLVEMSGGELRKDGQEKREDRRELREDRREQREDLRQG